MSISINLVGYRKADETFHRMKAVYDACKKAKIDPPQSVEKYFGYDSPTQYGNQIALKPDETPGITSYNENECDGFDVDLDKLPPEIRVLRFYNSY